MTVGPMYHGLETKRTLANSRGFPAWLRYRKVKVLKDIKKYL